MPTDQQTDANRANAQKSTGPRTDDGKANSSMNALKSGIYAKATIIRGENAADLDEVDDKFTGTHQPATPEERVQVDILVRCTWRGRRYDRAEAQLWNYTIDDSWKPNTETPLGKAFSLKGLTFHRLERLIDSNERRFRQATAELERLQQERLEQARQAAERAAAEQAAAEKAAGNAAAEAAAAPPPPEPAPPRQPAKSETRAPEFGFVSPNLDSNPAPGSPEVAYAPKIGFLAPNRGAQPVRNGGHC